MFKRPFMVEFTGTPEAGKTTVIRYLNNMLNSQGFSTVYLKESAEKLPREFEKGTYDANLWMHYTTQAGILRATHQNVDIVLIDRGLIDSKFYCEKFYKEKQCTEKEFEEFKRQCNERLNPDFLIAFTVSPEIAIKRRGGEGRLIKHDYLVEYNKMFNEYYGKLKIKKGIIDTGKYDVYEMNQIVYNCIIKAFQEFQKTP